MNWKEFKEKIDLELEERNIPDSVEIDYIDWAGRIEEDRYEMFYTYEHGKKTITIVD